MRQKFIGCEAEREEARIVLFGVAFDATCTYRDGARFAPSVIRGESFAIEAYSPYQDKDLRDAKIFDAGDLNFENIDAMLTKVEEVAGSILDAGKFPMMIGGEHLVTLGSFRAAAKKFPDICVVHFDAHTDLRDDWEGNPYNHSTVIKRCWDIINDSSFSTSKSDKRILQFGIRSGEKAEFEFAKNYTVLTPNNFEGLADKIKIIGSRPVYFTIDLDVLDPSEFGGTGTPEAGGVRFLDLLSAAKEVFESLNVVGCDIVELSPPHDMNGASTALACKFLRELLLLIK